MNSLVQQFEHAEREPARLEAIAPAIRFAKVKPTNNCNSKCITCDYWQHDYKGELTLDEITGALADLRALGVEEVMFTGGEPTMRKDLAEMVAAASDLGFANIGTTTNSLSLNDRKIDELVAAGLTEVVLSLEGPTLHDEIRGVPGNTKKVLRNLAYFRRSAPQVQVKIALTLMGINLGDVTGALDLAREHGVTLFLNLIDNGTYFFRGIAESLFEIADWTAFNTLIDELIEVKRNEPALLGNSVPSLEYARRYFKEPKQAQIPCYLGYVGVEVDANGDIFSNCWGLPPVGNMRQTSLSEILRSDAYKARCQAMYRKECGGCSCGYLLNLGYHPESRRAENGTATVGYAGEHIAVGAAE